MSFKQPYTVGLNNVGSYQAAGTPYLTGAIQPVSQTRKVEFENVTSRVIVRRIDSNGAAADTSKRIEISMVHPDQGNAQDNYHFWGLYKEGDEIEMRMKCKELYVTTNSGAAASWQLYAEMTNIPRASMYALTGSGITD